jgi:hypothetical protein
MRKQFGAVALGLLGVCGSLQVPCMAQGKAGAEQPEGAAA